MLRSRVPLSIGQKVFYIEKVNSNMIVDGKELKRHIRSGFIISFDSTIACVVDSNNKIDFIIWSADCFTDLEFLYECNPDLKGCLLYE